MKKTLPEPSLTRVRNSYLHTHKKKGMGKEIRKLLQHLWEAKMQSWLLPMKSLEKTGHGGKGERKPNSEFIKRRTVCSHRQGKEKVNHPSRITEWKGPSPSQPHCPGERTAHHSHSQFISHLWANCFSEGMDTCKPSEQRAEDSVTGVWTRPSRGTSTLWPRWNGKRTCGEFILVPTLHPSFCKHPFSNGLYDSGNRHYQHSSA